MTSPGPPSYSETGPPAAPQATSDFRTLPPAYTFPENFKIGSTRTNGLLVTIPQIKGHLSLLHAFATLRKEVETCRADIPNMPDDLEKRWAWFVHLSVERFDCWVRTLIPTDTFLPVEDTLPPLDILMVWHAYMLNPRWYMEDGLRMQMLATLHGMGKQLANALVRIIVISFSMKSQCLYGAPHATLRSPDSAPALETKLIECPRCQRPIQVPLMMPEGDGYFQSDFMTICAQGDLCGELIITKETLRARKLADNLSRVGEAPDAFLPGTFFTNSSSADQKASGVLKKRFCNLLKYNERLARVSSTGVDRTLAFKILEECEFSLAHMRARFGPHKLIGRIMSAHLEPMVYSVDLAGAVLRQGSFVKKMYDLGWTGPGYFDAPEDEIALQHALARYHAFMDLLASSPTSFFVPTLDIDLVWHTHQLRSADYAADCQRYISRFIDHDDKVDGFKLSSAFDITCRAWKDRFGIEYTYCGCPLPGDTIGQRLSRFLSSQRIPPISPSHLAPPPNRVDFILATHASEHNGVHFAPCNERVAKVMERRYRKHLARQERRGERERKKREEDRMYGDRDVYGHPYAFLYPVPMFYPVPVAGGETDGVEVGVAVLEGVGLLDVGEDVEALEEGMVVVVVVVAAVEVEVDVGAGAGVEDLEVSSELMERNK
ncbi:hypothetical protein CC1G_12143 [Coprinopsis cinerea okayama7|uniref:Uncharacterized protein n=1 Tax=Coprinopsis cinerea (strain Okayama-7 / 130 / ATCC MYA-4618 / FGSC 9003) TaxID=240176 RepID=A8P6Y4_COPC7|nr:hypothetical protein CC1G_12143 [Coprinopsis cinerea okayama7\|eukprot:XP_001839252.2 hypothetical protein CC1G_12143 [Coprinopsis cinerea okayama7\